ncbi:FtsX-like permease family protein [Kitasatospora sp. NPDC058063]|uniref:FtsX-like permease family protein n=1 Tax=unclassified Kitasatospora TaxID=2633591 RepID=UPI0036DB5901
MLSLATVRARWTSLLGTFVALGLGVTVLAMTALVLTSAEPEVPRRYAGTRVVVQSPAVDQSDGTFTPSRPWSQERTRELLRALAAVPGVDRAVPDRAFYAQPVIDGRPVGAPSPEPRGRNWSGTAFGPERLVAGGPPADEHQVVLDASLGLAPGSPVTLLTAAGPARYTVSGTASGTVPGTAPGALDAAAPGTVDPPSLYLSDRAAEALAPGVRVIGLVTAPRADVPAVAAAAASAVGGDGTVLHGAALTALEDRSAEKTRWIGLQILTATAGLTAFVSVFVVASTFAFAIVQRRREFGLLRTIGATPRQIARTVYAESLGVGVAAGGAGVLLGALLAPALGALMVEGGLEPAGFTVRFRALPLLGSFALGLVVALLGVWSASRRAARTAPLEALREAAVEHRPMTRGRWIAGGVSTALGLGLVVVAAGSESDSMINNALYAAMALIVGLMLFAPAVLPPIVRAVCRPLAGLRGATAAVARESAVTAVRRTASTAAPVLVTVGFAVLIAGLFQLRAGGYALEETVRQHATSVVTPQGTPGLSDAAVAAVPGGASLLPTRLYAGGTDHVGAVGMSEAAFRGARARMTVTSGSLDGLTGENTMVVKAGTAAWLGWTTGHRVPVTFEDGSTVDVTVVAEITDGSATASVLLTTRTVRAHDPSALTSVVHTAGATSSAVLAPLGARALSSAEYASRTTSEDDALVRIFLVVLIGTSLGYSCLAVANTLLMATAQRAGDFTVLRLSGATRRQVLRIVAVESTLVVGIGAALGLLIAVVTLAGVRSGLSARLGTRVDLALPWSTMALTTGLCLLLALLAGVLPSRAALRRPGARPAD